ncbi:RdgB/HAM1 family non-canonical purine NTP pyrophosphatase [Oscillatoria sp. FACHB-1406]|uniref:RdgB/HAM1 family non-canonical purine NTP pyrophosphatase n=1 Tax=Oscillatoria sp. FACHB-1406 TaxID=2692846 RepID=UPI001681F064|nr:RdgB/HAM1 family non-canonical purine NTP pyrophosphatase [Oscillatoria sp. FACHB-1406]MBD2578540.1 RdgB/HAM1 family non-canonical purine NTP pyrophosphatase [Oscillatoria sp. FACHB-1406]
MRTLIVASSNPGKVREMEAYLSQFDWKWGLMPPGLEIEETGTTFAENACLKASVVAKATGEWAIADDSGLAVDALDGAPGIYSARYAATDSERIARVLSELGNTDRRSAQFVCAIAIARPDGSIALQTEGICPGEILREPQGTEGFGYDPIFYVPELQMTFAQMPAEVKHEISHRARAFAVLLSQQSVLD